MSSIRNFKEKTSKRKRECYYCGHTISVKEKYKNIEVRYDGRILTFNKCIFCPTADIFELPSTLLKQLKKYE